MSIHPVDGGKATNYKLGCTIELMSHDKCHLKKRADSLIY